MSNKKESFFGHSKEQQEASIKRLDSFLDPGDSVALKENVAYIEKLGSLTLNMKRTLLGAFELDYLGKVFKLSTSCLIKGFLQDLPISMKQEILYSIQTEYKIGEVIDAQKRLVAWLRNQESKGVISLCEIANTTFV